MKTVKSIKKYLLSMVLVSVMFFICVYAFSSDKLEIFYEAGLLTISAEGVMPENIFMELGRECNIDIIAHGEVFPQKEVTLKLKDMPINGAVKRLVRVCELKNYLMDFKKDSQGKSRLVKIDLYMDGSGQRVLTPGEEIPAQKTKIKEIKKKPIKSTAPSSQKNKNNRPDKSSFSKDTNFTEDGSAPIDFPEYEGGLEFDESSYSWDNDAKIFTDKTMDIVSPGLRDNLLDQFIRRSEEVAKERGAKTITSDITAEALKRMKKMNGK
jgi:hypothetical protein